MREYTGLTSNTSKGRNYNGITANAPLLLPSLDISDFIKYLLWLSTGTYTFTYDASLLSAATPPPGPDPNKAPNPDALYAEPIHLHALGGFFADSGLQNLAVDEIIRLARLLQRPPDKLGLKALKSQSVDNGNIALKRLCGDLYKTFMPAEALLAGGGKDLPQALLLELAREFMKTRDLEGGGAKRVNLDDCCAWHVHDGTAMCGRQGTVKVKKSEGGGGDGEDGEDGEDGDVDGEDGGRLKRQRTEIGEDVEPDEEADNLN